MLYGDMTIEELDVFNMSNIRHKKDCYKTYTWEEGRFI